MKSTIGEFLLRRLREIGITEVIGVPGDFNLNFLEQFASVEGIEFVNAINELNGAYAADGYARERGVAALLTTYGVGELSAINGIAGANAEHLPIISIAGAPPLHAMREGVPLHHSMTDGNYINMIEAMGQFTAGRARLSPTNAVLEIDRLITLALQEKRPVHLQIPSDIAFLEIEVPAEPYRRPTLSSDPVNLADAVAEIVGRFAKAQTPTLLVDLEADRQGYAEVLLRIARENHIPWVSMVTSKAILPETDPLFLGVYNGDLSPDAVRARVEQSDLLIAVAPRFIEVNSGIFTQQLPHFTVELYPDNVHIADEVFEGVLGHELLDRLAAELPAARPDADASAQPQDADARVGEPEPAASEDEPWQAQVGAALTHARMWPRIRQFIRGGDVVVAEAGTSYLAMGALTLPEGVKYIASNIWGAIGFTLPATFGSLLAAPERRHLLFIGDGSFQLTAQELSNMLRHDQKPLIFLINNGGYTIERYIMGDQAHYNDVPAWDYGALVKAFDPDATMATFKVRTEDELERVLTDLDTTDTGALVELFLDPMDAPAALKVFGPASARLDYGRRRPELPRLG